MNTVISSASSGLLCILQQQFHNNFNAENKDRQIQETQLLLNFDIMLLCNSIIAGMVSVTSCSYNVQMWSAAFIGVIGSLIYTQTKSFLYRFEIDDPLDVSLIHGACGIWSIIALGLFDQDVGLLITGDATQLGI